MKILALDQFSEPGGAQRGLLDALVAFQRAGWTARVGLPGDGPVVESVRALGCDCFPIECGQYRSGKKSAGDWLRFATGMPQLALQIRRAVREFRPDLIYANGPRVLPGVAAAGTGVPVVFHSHSLVPEGVMRSVAVLALRASRARVIANCWYVAGQWDGFPVEVIYNGVEGPPRADPLVRGRPPGRPSLPGVFNEVCGAVEAQMSSSGTEVALRLKAAPLAEDSSNSLSDTPEVSGPANIGRDAGQGARPTIGSSTECPMALPATKSYEERGSRLWGGQSCPQDSLSSESYRRQAVASTPPSYARMSRLESRLAGRIAHPTIRPDSGSSTERAGEAQMSSSGTEVPRSLKAAPLAEGSSNSLSDTPEVSGPANIGRDATFQSAHPSEARIRKEVCGAGGPRADLGVRPTIACIGRIAPEKGQLKFVEAAREIHEAIPEARFVIWGASVIADPAYEIAVRRAAAGLPIEFAGWTKDVYAALAQTDLLLTPSTAVEATTRVIPEAWAAGVPVIAFASGGIAEIVGDGENGFLVANAREMAQCAVRLLKGDPQVLQAVTVRARRSWEERFHPEQFARGLIDSVTRAACANGATSERRSRPDEPLPSRDAPIARP